jgi:hypothetical protein
MTLNERGKWLKSVINMTRKKHKVRGWWGIALLMEGARRADGLKWGSGAFNDANIALSASQKRRSPTNSGLLD